MTVVVDASVLIAALVDSGPEGAWAEWFMVEDTAAAPELALAEASNVLRRMEQVGRISSLEATGAQEDLLRLNIELHPFAPFADRVWSLRHNLTCYDAWYVAVAEALACPLLTLDHRLSRAPGPTCEIVAPPA